MKSQQISQGTRTEFSALFCQDHHGHGRSRLYQAFQMRGGFVSRYNCEYGSDDLDSMCFLFSMTDSSLEKRHPSSRPRKMYSNPHRRRQFISIPDFSTQ
jgi:hypothetical protein